MIILKLSGGLGNQMSEYAFLRYLQKRYSDSNAIIDIAIPNKQKGNGEGGNDGFVLNHFNVSKNVKIIDSVACKEDYLSFSNRFWLFVVKVINKFKFLRWLNFLILPLANIFGGIIFENIYSIKPTRVYPSICKRKYVIGCFLGQEYMQHVNNQIRKEFIISENIQRKNLSYYLDILSSDSVCVHLRFGDYIKLSNRYDTLKEDYYEHCILEMRKMRPNTRFFIFSNDMNMAREKLKKFNDLIYIESNNVSWEEMQLMISCKNFIIANSSFSWWAQYLGTCENKIVFAPEIWYKDLPTNKILMKEWLLY